MSAKLFTMPRHNGGIIGTRDQDQISACNNSSRQSPQLQIRTNKADRIYARIFSLEEQDAFVSPR